MQDKRQENEDRGKPRSLAVRWATAGPRAKGDANCRRARADAGSLVGIFKKCFPNISLWV